MRLVCVVVRYPLCEDSAQMFLGQRNHKVETLSAYGSHQTFAVGVRLWCSRGRAQHPQSKSLELLVHLCREDRVTVADEETVGMIARNRFAKLLQSPGCRWMRGDVAMHDAPCRDLHQEKHIESSEPSGHHDQEIAGDDRLCVIADKRPPVLRRGPPVASSLRFGRPIGAHCTWRKIDTQLHRQRRCHTRLSPSRIRLRHLHNVLADVLRKSWPTSLRLPFPKQLETLAMPPDQGLGFDHYQGIFPIA